MLIVNLYPALMNHPADNLYALMNPGSEMTALPIILLSSAVWNKLLRTYPPAARPKKSPAGLEHGYGIQNIENTVNKYYGIMRITKNDAYKTDILIPIRNDV